MRMPAKPNQPQSTVFDCLLCRILALALAGQDYTQELATARTLASALEGSKR